MGDLLVETDLVMHCNLYVMGIIETEYDKTISIEGDLYCEGPIDGYVINVSGNLDCDCIINSTDIRVGENLYCGEDIQARNSQIAVAGNLECFKIDAEEICVLNKLKVKETITAEIVEVG